MTREKLSFVVFTYVDKISRNMDELHMFNCLREWFLFRLLEQDISHGVDLDEITTKYLLAKELLYTLKITWPNLSSLDKLTQTFHKQREQIIQNLKTHQFKNDSEIYFINAFFSHVTFDGPMFYVIHILHKIRESSVCANRNFVGKTSTEVRIITEILSKNFKLMRRPTDNVCWHELYDVKHKLITNVNRGGYIFDTMTHCPVDKRARGKIYGSGSYMQVSLAAFIILFLSERNVSLLFSLKAPVALYIFLYILFLKIVLDETEPLNTITDETDMDAIGKHVKTIHENFSNRIISRYNSQHKKNKQN